MERECEILALVLDEADENPRTAAELARGAQYLTRDADGRMALRSVESQAHFDRAARATGCFRRGKAIWDPMTREVIGYEMEAVTLHRAGGRS